MNGLSWLLYGAEVAANIKSACGILLIVGSIGGAIGTVFVCIELEWPREQVAKAWAKVLPIFVCCVLFLVVAPSRNTIMLIAASEVGETVLASKDAQELGGEAGALATDSLRLLRKYVSEQLDETKAE